MGRAFSDDLRRRVLQAYARGEGSEPEVAERFGVSLGYVKKIRSQQLRTGQMERIVHRPGRKPKFTAPVREHLRGWLRQQPALTLAGLGEKLREQVKLMVSLPALWVVLKKMGLRLKKSRSMPASGIRKRTGGGARSSWKSFAPSRRKS